MLLNKIRAHIWISGRVQGVFFRAYTQEKAQTLNLNGWVKNLHTGQVEAVFEGEKDIVEEMIQWCHHGPPSAAVTKVDIQWDKPANDLEGFDIK
ncbi:MAG: acylphosphatase [Planctomycetota bacterium]